MVRVIGEFRNRHRSRVDGRTRLSLGKWVHNIGGLAMLAVYAALSRCRSSR